jgi:site-specific DNA-methyltransferase (adenine-specific)
MSLALQNQIILGDCLEKMKDIPDNSIDFILTDLPYGVTARNKWDSVIDFKELWKQWNRIKKPETVITLTAQNPFSTVLINSNPEQFRYDLVWDKILSSGFLNANRQPLRVHEYVLVFYDKLGVYNPQKIKGSPTHSRGIKNQTQTQNYGKYVPSNNINDMKFPTSIIRLQKVQSGKCLHPTQKPVELFEYLIKTYSNEGDLVLDCCAGSGTTAIACLNTKRDYICIEKEPKYFEIMKNRITEHKSKLLLQDSVM